MRVLTAVPGWEAEVVVPPGSHGLQVVRRCQDLEDLLATAATGVAQAALVSSTLPRLDGDALARLRALGVAVVGLAPPGEEAAERRLRQLGLAEVRPADSPVADLADALERALREAAAAGVTGAFAHAQAATLPPAALAEHEPRPAGRVVAVWGPTGAPGRTTVATGVAQALARLGWPTLLVDADPYGGAVACALSLPEDVAGLAAACRRANLGTLDAASLADLVVAGPGGLGVLTGLDRAERWPELRPAALDVVLALARARAAVTVVDCGFCLEQDEELSYDTLAPRRNGATLAVLQQADLVLAVGSADALGLQRLLHGLVELREAAPDARSAVVLNRVGTTAVPGEVQARLQRDAGVERVLTVPLDLALAQGRATGPAVQKAFGRLAADLVGRR